jgi:hypothetical protein
MESCNPSTEDPSMPNFRLPLSGDVTQTFNIDLGTSSNPEIEKQVLSDPGEALIVLLKHVKMEHLSQDDEMAIRDLKCMLHEIANVKERHGAKHIVRPLP